MPGYKTPAEQIDGQYGLFDVNLQQMGNGSTEATSHAVHAEVKVVVGDGSAYPEVAHNTEPLLEPSDVVTAISAATRTVNPQVEAQRSKHTVRTPDEVAPGKVIAGFGIVYRGDEAAARAFVRARIDSAEHAHRNRYKLNDPE